MRPNPLTRSIESKVMTPRHDHSGITAQIDLANSWSADSLVPSDTYELSFDAIKPRSLPIRVSPLKTRVTGFMFPEANQWIPPKPPPSQTSEDKEAIEKVRRRYKTIKHHRVKPPNDVVKLQDRLYYLLQPPLDLLVGSGQLNFPFDPFAYQLDGIAFLFPRYAAVLADEMGLGKTMQAISTIRLLLCSGEVRSVLLVCPKPLVTNWLREFSVWAPEIPVTAIEGNAAKREHAWRSPEIPVKVANYELLMRDKETVLESGLHFDLVALDEAQRIKNRNSTTSEIVRAIPRTRSWALTGTPVENSPDDLVGIFDYLSPGYLKVGMPMAEMAKRSKDYIMRRTKDMVMNDMPPKLYRDAELDLTPEQWATYEQAESEGIVKLEEMDQELTIQHVFELVLRLKQICNFDPPTGSSVKLERMVADMEEVVASGKKAIVFSQWVNSIDKMLPAMQRFGPLEYHGRVPHKKRDGVIDQFKNDPNCSVILMSYGAGSVGLNLQFCEYVFLFDRWWNPAIEDQAINRAHRIGARGAVTVTRMLAMNTIEQRIASVLDEKRQMFDALFSDQSGPTKGSGGGLSRDEIFGLFDLRAPGGKKVA
ncbi:ATP-dependent helicase HepA [Rubripirellula lacrimiformis]|uniref:ATP-dependent helicase HepA n=1 Tax=Rubripirellula lacrimiformis TaxID=1930273 RepID=A0A517NH63_9BACT|nr:DEAD/DEAH box helicase [Rubripirellula lacrimiformis]QDT06477.1 ATP-dependent helicase HepA [Rubripirellula lacrimiformis]